MFGKRGGVKSDKMIFIRTCSAHHLNGPDTFPERGHCIMNQKILLVV